MQARSDPGCRFVVADPIHPIHNLDLLRRAPTGDECVGERNTGEIERQRIVDDAARAVWGRGPTIGTTVRVEPCEYLIEATAQSFRWHRDPDPHRGTGVRPRERLAVKLS